MAPVAGTPPNTGAARFARPCPNSSRSGSVVWLTLMPSATVADSRLSSAASAAIASADGSIALNVAGSRKPKDGAGRPRGMSPSRSAPTEKTCATTVARPTARSENGTPGLMRAPTSMIAATPSAIAIEPADGSPTKVTTASSATRHTWSSPEALTPSATGTCWSAMTTAIPAVNPSTTGIGR